MLFKMFTVYDSAAGAYVAPFFLAATGQALRQFTDAVNDPASSLCQHPEDYTLYEIGTYEDTHATVTMHETSKMLGRAIEYKTHPGNIQQAPGDDSIQSEPAISNVSPIQPDTIG